MASNPTSASPLFLRETEIRHGIELLIFAHAELMRSGDAILQSQDLGRAHHRALYFIARKPGVAIGELMAFLTVTKQSLGRVLRELEQRELIAREPGQHDRRQILLKLTKKGENLEGELFDALRSRMIASYSDAGPNAVTGFWAVLEQLLPEDRRNQAMDLAESNR